MAPLSEPAIESITLATVGPCLIVALFITGVCLYRRRSRDDTLLSSPTANETQPSDTDNKVDERTPLLSPPEDQAGSSDPLAQRAYSAPRSSDLAFALGLPRPSAHLHHPATLSSSPAAAGTIPSGTSVERAVEEPLQPDAEDGGAVSARGCVRLAVVPGGDRVVRRTDIVARHPRFRRRVRTWDIGAAVPEQTSVQREYDSTVQGEVHTMIDAVLGRTDTW